MWWRKLAKIAAELALELIEVILKKRKEKADKVEKEKTEG